MIDFGQTVEVKWSGASKSKYVELGYQFTKLGDTFQARLEHLPLYSTQKVNYSCDYCGKEFNDKPYVDIVKQRKIITKDVCKTQDCKLKKRKELFSHIFIPSYTDSLAYNFPDLLNEWDTKKNGGIEPYEIHAGSARSVWWKCSKGHEWEDRVGVRTRNSTVCKKCALENYNLENTYPDVAKEWHPTKNGNLTPDSVTPMNGKKIWWICEKGHEWEAKVLNRTGNKSGCPRCNVSKGEKKVEEFLIANGFTYEKQHQFEDCRNIFPLRFDFVIFDKDKISSIIEYDGEQHYKGRARSDPNKSGETLKRIQRNDKIKNEYCKEKKLNLIRIPYWDLNNIEKILSESLRIK